ncbi:class I SAM-dependent methyltransferase, partial [Thiopseudomonas alkaliphila]
MVSELRLYTEAEWLTQAQHYSAVLLSRGVQTCIETVEKLNARFLRLNPELALCVDAEGLWLCANGMKMQPDWKAEIGRLKRASLKSEMIARACNLSEKPSLIDATAGLGHDSLLMAHLGASVTLLERHPILFTLLEDAKRQAADDPFLASVVARIQLVFIDS